MGYHLTSYHLIIYYMLCYWPLYNLLLDQLLLRRVVMDTSNPLLYLFWRVAFIVNKRNGHNNVSSQCLFCNLVIRYAINDAIAYFSQVCAWGLFTNACLTITHIVNIVMAGVEIATTSTNVTHGCDSWSMQSDEIGNSSCCALISLH